MQRRRWTIVRSTARRKALFAKKKQKGDAEEEQKKTVPCPAQKETKAATTTLTRFVAKE